MDTEYVQTQCVLADGAERFGIAAIAFDQHEELVWMGNEGGHVTSYYGGMMQKYTSFQVHGSLDIRQLMPIDEGILALTASTLRCQIRRGIPLFTYTSANMSDMQCMLQLAPDRLLVAGHQNKLIDFNLALYKESNVVHVGDTGCVMLRAHNRLVCAGDPVGRIDLRDPNTLNIEHTLESHSGSLSDFDVQGNLLVTCGFSNRQGTLSVDRFLMVYDLRMMRAVTPIQVVVDPLLLRFLPAVSSRLAVVSTLGQVQLVDTVALSEPRLCLYQVDSPGAMCTAFDISTSSQAMAFGDTSGSIHMLVCAEEPIFNSYSRLTEHADATDTDTYPSFGVDDMHVPYASVPLPLPITMCGLGLASDWPQQFMQTAYRRTPPIDPNILKTMKVQGPIGYAPNPKTFKRNQVPYNVEHHLKIPLKLEKNKNGYGYEERNGAFVAIPKRYRRVDVKYTKLGTDDFPFDHYNKTGLPGLEATLPNAYCNAMLQVLYYTEPLRAALLSHLCPKEFCLSCELGFLFHMLCTSRGAPCQPANFLRAFRTVPEASALSLILSDLHPEAKLKTDLGSLIQSWNRFILHQMHCELFDTKKRKLEEKLSKKEVKPFVYKETDFPSIHDVRYNNKNQQETTLTSSISTSTTTSTSTSTNVDNTCNTTSKTNTNSMETEISNLFGMKQLQMNCCLKCGHEVRKESILLACNLVYPSTATATTTNNEMNELSFCDLLCSSLCPQQTTPAWCDSCDKFSPTSQARILNSLPKILVINTGLHNAQYKQFWQKQIDIIVAKATTTTTANIHINSNNNDDDDDYKIEEEKLKKATLIKQCRYGVNCARPGCRFRHETTTIASASAAAATTTTTTTTITTSNNNINPYYNNTWLPHNIIMALDKENHLSVKQLESTTDETQIIENSKKYSLSAVVCYVNDQQSLDKRNRNIVALIRIPYNISNDGADEDKDKWYLFNDISISEVSAQEAVWFSLDWKVPCVLYYSSSQVLKCQTEISAAITLDVFGDDKCLARSNTNNTNNTNIITFTPLAANEMPKPGELVAMDAEFVTLNQEEAELRSDGKMSTIKPSHMSVARITCIRGQGPLEGTPFIDDYISTQEQVVDYLTKFSGIKPGDLDANFSSKHLTTLKSTYQKLRFLQDSGVVFVGHGLKNDFRVINLVVPPEQVVDTVLLFHLPHHRMVSLRFLAWHFLGLKIQSETHDSVEDARAALQLYKRYKQLESDNKLAEALTELYETGKLLQWKVPDDSFN